MFEELLGAAASSRRLARLARVAEVHPDLLRQARRGKRKLTLPVRRKLKLAIARLAAEDAEQVRLDDAYRLVLVLAALALKQDPAAVKLQSAEVQRPSDPKWLAAAHVRCLAVYALNTMLGYRQARIAKAAGLTRQGVHRSVKAIEELRDGTPWEEPVAELERWLVGLRADAV